MAYGLPAGQELAAKVRTHLSRFGCGCCRLLGLPLLLQRPEAVLHPPVQQLIGAHAVLGLGEAGLLESVDIAQRGR